MTNLSNRLKALRSEEKLSQKALAEKIYVSQQTVAKWELNTATPNPETIVKLARLFNCTTDYLLGISDKKTPDSNYAAERDKKLISLLSDLTPAEEARILDFVAGLKSAHKDSPYQNRQENWWLL